MLFQGELSHHYANLCLLTYDIFATLKLSVVKEYYTISPEVTVMYFMHVNMQISAAMPYIVGLFSQVLGG